MAEEHELTDPELIDLYSGLNAHFENIKAARKEMFASFERAIRVLFLKYDKLESLGWNQYTPYFNDGEACEFSVNCDYLHVNGDEFDSSSYAEKYYKPEERNGLTFTEACDVVKTFRKFARLISDEDFRSHYGDHVEVTITRNGVTTSYYEHG